MVVFQREMGPFSALREVREVPLYGSVSLRAVQREMGTFSALGEVKGLPLYGAVLLGLTSVWV